MTAKVDRMAFIFARLGCSNPNEQTSGKAMAFLKEDFQVAALNDPQTFSEAPRVQDVCEVPLQEPPST